MARLTAKARRGLRSSTFAGPNRSYPIPDKGHAKAALALAHHAPASAQPQIRARAHAMLASKHMANGGLVLGGPSGGGAKVVAKKNYMRGLRRS